MTQSLLSLRKFTEILNCVNETDAYQTEITPTKISIYKFKTLIHEYPTNTEGILSAHEYLVRQLASYLKEGGWIEKET